MRTRLKWVAVAGALLLGAVVAIAQGCGPDQNSTVACPATNGLYDPTCCNVNGSGCGVPCDNPTADLAVCCSFFSACEDDMSPPPGNCADWWQFWCAPDGGAAAATTSSGGPTGCAGDCVPLPPLDWQGPALFWQGNTDSLPTCPSNAPVTAYQANAALLQPDAGSCTSCTCSIDGGSCSLPEHVTAGSGTCSDAGTFTADFDPPAAWDGGCTDADAIPPGALCKGAACVVSLTAGPLALTPPACTPSATTPVDAGLPSWSTAAIACVGNYPASACDDLTTTCAPAAASAPGFVTCIFQPGEIASCPEAYPVRHVVYSGFDDHRACAPCTCGAPDSTCAATLDVFDDGACLHKFPVLSLGLGPAGTCGDLLDAGVALGSKQIDGFAYDAGSCTPGGGDASGGFVPVGAATFCCLESA